MVCHRDFHAVADDFEVATQVISQLSYSSFHRLSMALSAEHFWPYSQSWRCLPRNPARKMRVDRDALWTRPPPEGMTARLERFDSTPSGSCRLVLNTFPYPKKYRPAAGLPHLRRTSPAT